MKFYRDRSKRDESKGIDPQTGESSDYHKIIGNFDFNLHEIDILREGLQWVMTKSKQYDDETNQNNYKLAKQLKQEFGNASVALRFELGRIPK